MGNIDSLKEKLIELELAKSDNKNSRIKKYLPAVVIMASLYYSMVLAVGLLIGYMGSRIFSKHLLEKGKVDSIYIDCGKWKIHFHHWIMGMVVLLLMWAFYEPYLSSFLVGLILGVMAHDIYDYNDWHRVLVKNENYKAGE